MFVKSFNKKIILVYTNIEVNTMNKQEKINEQKSLNKFNSVTQKHKPENQNQSHNVREEGIGPVNQKR